MITLSNLKTDKRLIQPPSNQSAWMNPSERQCDLLHSQKNRLAYIQVRNARYTEVDVEVITIWLEAKGITCCQSANQISTTVEA